MIETATAVNVVFAGLGGMGVLKASDILADCAFREGFDVKKSEIHGMSQRGGSVASDVRFGKEVLSPMIPSGEADFLVVLDETQVEPNRYKLREGGILISTQPLVLIHGPMMELDERDLPLSPRNFNVAVLGMLSCHLDFTEESWESAIRAHVPGRTFEQNMEVFSLGRRFG